MSNGSNDIAWYWAEIIEEIRIAGEADNIVLLNTVLIRAGSPDQAYERALELGREYDSEYVNSDGQTVTCRFRGLRDIGAIYDGLEHGSELFYSEETCVSEEELAQLATPKEDLTLFQSLDDEAD